MINFFSNIFGYILNFIYNIFKNYGISIILFSFLIKIILLPLSIKQQKNLTKTTKIQEKTKEIQAKYKGNQEKLNQELMDLYKRENVSPFGGCLSSIIQIILILAMFYLVRSPLTYMKKIDSNVIENYKTEINQETGENSLSKSYPEISIIKDIYQKGETDSELYINMEFLGLDLSNIPRENYNDWTVYIIPVLYVISSMISISISTKMTNNINKKEDIVIENKKEDSNDVDITEQMNKQMKYTLPIISVMIAIIAPLGLALYWLVNNICMIIERLIINKILTSKEE